jgi:hypothetical protein
MPISGTDFVRYIAMISFLAEYMKKQGLDPIRPKVIYAASGGCLAAYIAMMSSFTSNIEEWSFSSEMFIKRPTPITPRLLTFALRGYLYHRTDLTEYIKEAFIPCKLQDVEIITGYYEPVECTSKRSIVKIVSNYPQSLSALTSREPNFKPNICIVHPEEKPAAPTEQDTDPTLYRSNLKKYLDGLMLLVSDALHKTTNIPLIMEPIGESKCIDYGIVAPSPRVIAGASSNRSIYFSPVDLDRVVSSRESEMFFHQYILNDIFLLSNQFSKSKKFTKTDTYQSFKEVLTHILTLARYCLVIYSAVSTEIDINSFTNNTIKNSVKLCKTGLRFIVFYD